MESKIIEKYLIAVEQFKESKFDRISEQDFSKFVQNAGLTKIEIQSIQVEHTRLSQQAKTYAESGNYEESVRLLEQALAIEPFQVNNHLLIVDCYKNLYLATHDDAYAELGIQYCKRGLHLDSSQAYFAQVETALRQLQGQRSKYFVPFIALIFSLVVLLTSVGLFVYNIVDTRQTTIWGGWYYTPNIPLLVFMCVAGLFHFGSWIWWGIRYGIFQTKKQKLKRLHFNQPTWGNAILDKIMGFVDKFTK